MKLNSFFASIKSFVDFYFISQESMCLALESFKSVIPRILGLPALSNEASRGSTTLHNKLWSLCILNRLQKDIEACDWNLHIGWTSGIRDTAMTVQRIQQTNCLLIMPFNNCGTHPWYHKLRAPLCDTHFPAFKRLLGSLALLAPAGLQRSQVDTQFRGYVKPTLQLVLTIIQL